MRANVGDTLVLTSNTKFSGDERRGEIVEVRGADGAPPYLVRFADGHEAHVFPGPGRTIEPA